MHSSTFDGMSTTPDPIAVPRATAARLLGVSPATLRDWSASRPPRGPRGIKIGPDRRARVIYPLADLRQWAADPVGYERSRRGPPNERHR